MIKGAKSVCEAVTQEMKRRRREDRRSLIVKSIGSIILLLGGFGSFFYLAHLTGVERMLFDVLGDTLGSFLFMVLFVGYVAFLFITFFWLSDKTGLHYLIEDWVVSWDSWDAEESHHIQKYKEFPRRKRRSVIRELKKELDVLSNQLYDLEIKADETDDENLSNSVESIDEVINTLVTEADISSRSILYQPEYASWKGFVLALEEASNELEQEMEDTSKYHKEIQPLLKKLHSITAKVFSGIVDSNSS